MNMRWRYVVVILLALAAVGAVIGRRHLYGQMAALAAPISSQPAQSFLVILGVGETAETVWDGSITATGATILSLQGW